MCPGVDKGSVTTDISTSRTITVQQEGSDYIITVTAVNAASSSAPSNAVIVTTRETGEPSAHIR